jgi:penicillin-binding protein 1C
MILRFLKSKIKILTLISGLTLVLLAAIFGLCWVFLKVPEINFPVSPTLLDSQGRIIYSGLARDGQWLWPEKLPNMGLWLKSMTVSIEDKRFFSHHGVDLLAVLRAMGQNIKDLRIVSGASTITVQTIKLLSPPDKRTFGTKIKEFILALKLERLYTKDEILEIYLNIAPFGGNIKGAAAASYAYFHKSPADLSLGESVTLIAILRGPSVYRPDRYPEKLQARRDLLLERLYEKSQITLSQKTAAMGEPVLPRREPIPQNIPHLANLVLERYERAWVWGAEDYDGLYLTINSSLQAQLEKRLLAALEQFPQEVTGAAAVTDNSGRLLAYVGNARPKGPYGYVDCALAKRSPGSTLKTFVYLAAMEEGRLIPASLLADTPLGLEGMAPRNFDEKHRGPVSVKTALSESLNVPAVRVLRLIGNSKALEVLKRAGFTLDSKRDYGDSLILGGCEVTLWQVLAAYGTLARQGQNPGLRLLEKENPPQKLQEVFTPQAAWLTNEILREPGRLPRGLADDGLAFKTGTSHGFRDAWFAVYSGSYTAVFWLGDPTGQGHRNLSGLKALAEPAVLFMRDLGAVPPWPKAPAGLSVFRACPVSGEPAGPFCPDSQLAYRLTSLAKTHPCRLHVRENGQTVLKWPRDLAGFMAKNGAVKGNQKWAFITSPPPGGVIRQERETEAMPLKSEGTVGPVYWYMDGEFLAASLPGQTPVWPLKAGRHLLSLVDRKNQTAHSEFTVIKAPPEENIPVIRLKPAESY